MLVLCLIDKRSNEYNSLPAAIVTYQDGVEMKSRGCHCGEVVGRVVGNWEDLEDIGSFKLFS